MCSYKVREKSITTLKITRWSRYAGGEGAEERTKKVNDESALKVFDAIEGAEGVKPRLILVSSLDIKDPEKIPALSTLCEYLNPSTKFISFLCLFLT